MIHNPTLRRQDEMTPPDDEEEDEPRMTRDDYEELQQELRREMK